jgi:hypothetical protein
VNKLRRVFKTAGYLNYCSLIPVNSHNRVSMIVFISGGGKTQAESRMARLLGRSPSTIFTPQVVVAEVDTVSK